MLSNSLPSGFGGRADAIRHDIRRQIVAGKLAAGERLPSTVELAKLYRVSKDTVSQAMAALAEEGVVVRKRGAGSHVAAVVAAAGNGLCCDLGIYLPMLSSGGEVLSPMASPVWFQIFNGVLAQSEEAGYRLSIIPRSQTPLTERLMRHPLAGILIPGSLGLAEEYLTGNPPPEVKCLFLGLPGGLKSLNYVEELDDAHAAAVVETLRQRGFRRIAAVASNADDYVRMAVWRGYRQAMAGASDYSPRYEKMFTESASPEEYVMAVRELMALPQPPEAIVVFRARFVPGVLQALADLRIRVPQQVSVVMVENDAPEVNEILGRRVAGAFMPSKAEVGRIAARALIGLIEQSESRIQYGCDWSWQDGDTLKSIK